MFYKEHSQAQRHRKQTSDYKRGKGEREKLGPWD